MFSKQQLYSKMRTKQISNGMEYDCVYNLFEKIKKKRSYWDHTVSTLPYNHDA